MNAQLVALDTAAGGMGSDRVEQYVLVRLPVIVGRAEEADVRIKDCWVSRLHCQIEERKGVLFIKDLHSKHGTWVNHIRVEESLMFPGDELEIGLTTLRAEYEVSSCHLK